MRDRRHLRRPGRRDGFTLVELLGVILIIAILMAIAFPAYQSVMRTAKTTQIKTEIASLEAGIGGFKAKFGIDPPSRISFIPSGGTGAPNLPAATKAILRQMFPQVSYDTTLQAGLTRAGLWEQELTSGEALTFFLGGVRRNSTTGSGPPATTDLELVGFSNNPANPFAQPPASGGSRIGPFFEFDSGRLVDPETDGVLAFADATGNNIPYAYASAAGGGTYRQPPAGYDTPELSNGPYRRSAGGAFWNPNSFQIISAGFGGVMGTGGPYDPKKSSTLPTDDQDNITNFSEGTLLQ